MYSFSKTLVLTSGIEAEGTADLFLGGLPARLEFASLSGVSDVFSTIQFGAGSFISKGSLIIGGAAPSGIIQVVDLGTNSVSSVDKPPVLKSYNITDVTK